MINPQNNYILFEIQSPDSTHYASPYVRQGDSNIDEVKNQIFQFLNEKNINFVIKEGAQINQLTRGSTLSYQEFFMAYVKRQ